MQREIMPDPEARNVAIFVEPSPFSHISGMKNRFECLIKNLTDQGDNVMVFTPDRAPPKEYFGAKARPLALRAFRLFMVPYVYRLRH
jgi:sulfoquinovosyltransferase